MMRKWLSAFVILLIILILVSATGCTTIQQNVLSGKTTARSIDPETGIQSWMTAINQKDVSRLYNLAPDEIKQRVSYEQFVNGNKNNTLLKPGLTFTQYIVLNETFNDTAANIKAVLALQIPNSQNSTQAETIGVNYDFILLFEHGEWKVWTI
jgi:hypothetical protein